MSEKVMGQSQRDSLRSVHIDFMLGPRPPGISHRLMRRIRMPRLYPGDESEHTQSAPRRRGSPPAPGTPERSGGESSSQRDGRSRDLDHANLPRRADRARPPMQVQRPRIFRSGIPAVRTPDLRIGLTLRHRSTNNLVMSENGRPANRVAIVTGASSGVGREVALLLARRGYHLVLISRRKQKLEDLAGEISRHAGSTVITCDLCQSDAIAGMAAGFEANGPVEVLINNAGHGLYQPFLKHSAEDFLRL